MCRSRRELSNEYLLAKIRFDTAENEPCILYSLPALCVQIAHCYYYRSPRLLRPLRRGASDASAARVGQIHGGDTADSRYRQEVDVLRSKMAALHKDLNEQRAVAEEQDASIRRLRESRDQLRGKNQADSAKRQNLRIWMSQNCALTDDDIDAIEAGFGEAVDTARAFARAMLPNQPQTMFFSNSESEPIFF